MIVCVGESLIDFVPAPSPAVREGVETGLPHYRPVAGGSPFNCAVAAARLGADVSFAGGVSTDFFGDHIVERLSANGVDTAMVRRMELPTTLAFVERGSDGAARYAFYTTGAADRALTLDHLPAELPHGAILQMGSISLIADPQGSAILDLAEREYGQRVIAFDPNIREVLVEDEGEYRERINRALDVATVLKTSDEDLAWIFRGRSLGSAARAALDAGVRLVVVTRGAEGSVAYTHDREIVVEAERVAISDTIGAGDSFLAALLVRLDERGVTSADAVASLDEATLLDALRFASRVSAITCSRVGADPPRRDELSDSADS
jgi:fructokinase